MGKCYAVLIISVLVGTCFAILNPNRRYASGSEFTCDLIPDVDISHGKHVPPRSGNNGFSVAIEGQQEGFIAGNTYTVSLKTTHPVTMRGFAISANFERSQPAGELKILNPWVAKYMDLCPNVITHRTTGKKSNIQLAWTAPVTDKCVVISASVIQKGVIWFKGTGNLSFRFCPLASAQNNSVDVNECCSCGSAVYRMDFYGLWSPQSHPKDYPRFSTHWSNVIGASHSNIYTIWELGGYSSEGVKRVAEWGWPNTLEDEIRGQGSAINSVIKTRAQWPAYQRKDVQTPLTNEFEVDKEHHLVSLLSMLGPSPDWNVGITRESMCTKSCGWIGKKTFDLTPWDAGTDSGVSYMSPNSPTHPVERIRFLTSSDHPESPFYEENGGPIPPVARVVLTRLSITGDQCGVSDNNFGDADPLDVDVALNTPQDCVYTKWSPWSDCGVTCGWGIKMRTKTLTEINDNCENKITEKEICRGIHDCDKDNDVTVCLYTDWTAWSSCNGKCNVESLKLRTRELKWPSEPIYCTEPLKEMSKCPPTDCPGVDSCMYTDWTKWMPCSVTCGVGQTIRKRFIKRNPTPESECSEPLIEQSKCMASEDCQEPVGFLDIAGCHFSPWSEWMPCPSECGVGETFRKRVLDLSDNDSIKCDHVQMERTKCMTSELCGDVAEPELDIETCMYTEWTDWMPCSKSCGIGLTFRKSLLKATPISMICDEVRMENVSCHMPPCRNVDVTTTCRYGEWQGWTPCSKTCGHGVTFRKRFLHPSITANAECVESEMETNKCTVPMSCATSPLKTRIIQESITCNWSEWSDCSATCGQGKQMRRKPSECSDNLEIRSCTVRRKCPVDCVVSEWSDWSKCAPCLSADQGHTSQTGMHIRTRRRLRKRRLNGAPCPIRKERKSCEC